MAGMLIVVEVVHRSDSIQGTDYIENLRWQFGEDIKFITFRKFVTMLV